MHAARDIEQADRLVVGVISDTHGQLHSGVLELFRNCDAIIHAGDICGYGVYEGLREIAPLYAVAGNCDSPHVNPGLPGFDLFTLAKIQFVLIHKLSELDIDPHAIGVRVVVHGHTHEPEIRRERGILYLNPGSAGPRRFSRPRTVAILNISTTEISAKIVEFGT